MTAPVTETVTSQLILAAARTCLFADGYAGLSTRKVAQEAGVPLSQVHYHFGSKGGLVLALLETENRRRLARQSGDVRRGFLPLASLRAGMRLPRRRPRVGLCPRAPGDDRRRVVHAGHRRRGRGRCWPAGTGCSPRWPPRRRRGSVASARSDRPKRLSSSATPSSARRRCSCSASTVISCRSGRACVASAS